MKFDVQLWAGNQWKQGDETIATIEAEDLDDAQAQALALVGATASRPMQSAYDEGLDGVHERRVIAEYPSPELLDRTERSYYDDEGGGHRLTVTAWSRLEREHAEVRSDLQHWTDREAVDAAFAALREAGIQTREAIDDCGSCAWAAAEDGPAVIYNQQSRDIAYSDWDKATSDYILEGLAVAFGFAGGSDTMADRAVGVQAQLAFEREGLRVSWDGNPQHGMIIDGLSRRFDLGWGEFWRQYRLAHGDDPTAVQAQADAMRNMAQRAEQHDDEQHDDEQQGDEPGTEPAAVIEPTVRGKAAQLTFMERYRAGQAEVRAEG